jgi:hypothetical protein
MNAESMQEPNWAIAPEWAMCYGLYQGEWCWFSGTDSWGVEHKSYRPETAECKQN